VSDGGSKDIVVGPTIFGEAIIVEKKAFPHQMSMSQARGPYQRLHQAVDA
jgi:hypothetical protein